MSHLNRWVNLLNRNQSLICKFASSVHVVMIWIAPCCVARNWSLACRCSEYLLQLFGLELFLPGTEWLLLTWVWSVLNSDDLAAWIWIWTLECAFMCGEFVLSRTELQFWKFWVKVGYRLLLFRLLELVVIRCNCCVIRHRWAWRLSDLTQCPTAESYSYYLGDYTWRECAAKFANRQNAIRTFVGIFGVAVAQSPLATATATDVLNGSRQDVTNGGKGRRSLEGVTPHAPFLQLRTLARSMTVGMWIWTLCASFASDFRPEHPGNNHLCGTNC
jgi:hypothetical protein